MNQYDKILNYIKKNGSITPMDAFRELGITKLATRVSEMRRSGIEFDIEKVYYKNNDGNTTFYCEYRLHEMQ